MPLPADCKSLDQVRAEIDRIDRAVVALLGERAGYVHAAARFKAIATVTDSGPELSLVARDPAEQQQDRARVESALKQLPPEQRQVVEMAYYEGLSQREIAGRTGDPLGTVKTRVRLGMEKLSHLLREEGVSPS